MTQWVRLWEDMPNDPKWRVVAKRAKRPVSEVMAVFVHMMTNACGSATRGTLANWSDEDVATAIDAKPAHVAAIREAMQGKTLDGDHLTGWEKRQPLREDGSAERAKAWREQRKRQAAEQAELPLKEPERVRTDANATERQKRVDSEEKETTLHRGREELETIESALRQAADLVDDPSPALFDLSPIIGLLDAGFDLESQVLPIVRAKRRKGVRTWGYFVPAIKEAATSWTVVASGSNARAGPRAPPDEIRNPLVAAGAKYFENTP